MKIKIGHIDKIEGHLGFEASLYRGNVKSAFTDVLEGARLIEGIIRDRPYEDIPIITSRICGVCPVVHNLASIKAIEDAMGVRVNERVRLFRKLMLMGEIVQSHILHVFFLSAPDFLGNTNDIELISLHPKEAELAFLVRDFSVRIMTAVGGRSVHPIASEVGGFKILPKKKVLQDLLVEVDNMIKAAIAVHNFIVGNIKLPDLKTEIMPISFYQHGEYPFYEGRIISSNKLNTDLDSFYHSIEELQKPRNVVKQTEIGGKRYMVGALARLLNSSENLHPEAKKLFLKMPEVKLCVNPFYNLFAQSIEIVHSLEESKELIKKLLEMDYPASLSQNVKLKAGEGIGSVEAPRGVLLHYYKINKDGRIIDSNIMTPTAQFLNHLDYSLRIFLPQVASMTQKDRDLQIKSLVRSYDPCISCATH